MAKKADAGAIAAPTLEPEPQVAPEPVEGQVAEVELAPEAEPEVAPEKPDVRTLLAELPEDERDALFEDKYGERLRDAEERANVSAWNRMDQKRATEAKANADLQTVVKNVSEEVDPVRQAQHIQAYHYAQVPQVVAERDALWFAELGQAYNLSEQQMQAEWNKAGYEAAQRNEVLRPSDFVKYLTGEKFMPKAEVSKALREEIKAIMAEEQGKRIKAQAENAPVSVGLGEPPTGLTLERFRAMSTEERAKLTPEQKDAMMAEEHRRRGILA